MAKKRCLSRWTSASVGVFWSISSSFRVWISQDFVERFSIVPLLFVVLPVDIC